MSNTPQSENAPESFWHDDMEDASDDGGLSLDELSRAFADVLGRGDDPYKPAPPRTPLQDEQDEQDEQEQTSGACEISPSSILEAMLFVGSPDNEPLTSVEVASLMRGVTAQEVDELVVELNETYREQNCPYEIVSVGQGYRMQLRPEFQGLRDVFYGRMKEAKLSQAAIDVLAIVAYNQPITRQEVDDVRGKPSGSLLTQLVRRQVLRIEKTDEKPRKTLYHTTDRFLHLFGLSSLNDLPRSEPGG